MLLWVVDTQARVFVLGEEASYLETSFILGNKMKSARLWVHTHPT